MRTFQIAKGLIISTPDGEYEFSDRIESEIYFQSYQTGKRLIVPEATFWAELDVGLITISSSVASQKAVISEVSGKENTPLISDLPEKFQDDFRRKLHYINELLSQGVTRGCRSKIHSLIPKIAEKIQDKFPPGASTIQTWWKNYELGVDPYLCLVSKNAYRQRAKVTSEQSEVFLQDQIQLHYAQLTRPSINDAYRMYVKHLRQENKVRALDQECPLQEVSSKTFYNRIKALPQKELLISRYGYEYARKKLKVSQGNLPSAYPLDVVEIDHTLMNLYVVDDISFLPLGRPWITSIKDRQTNILLGFYISFHGGGLQAIFGAIKHSLRSHQMAFDLWEFENPWPAFGLGNLYCSDRGADFMSQQYWAAIHDLGASYELCERRTPWLKGSIERFFLTLEKTFFETLPGKTFRSLADRHDYNPVQHAVIRFSTLVFLMHKWAVDYHNVTAHSRKMASPLELWNEGIGFAPPPFPVSTKSLDIVLGERHQGKVRNDGIQFLGLHYADQNLQDLVDDLDKGFKVDFIITPENLGYIHIKDPRNGEYMRVNSTRPDYAHGLTLFQHKYLRHEAKLYSDSENSIEKLFTVRSIIEDRVKEDILAKENHHKKQLSRVAAINSNAILQQKIRSVKNPFANALENDASKTLQSASFTNIPIYQWGG